MNWPSVSRAAGLYAIACVGFGVMVSAALYLALRMHIAFIQWACGR